MKKIFRKSNIFSFLLGAIIFGGIGVVSAYTIFANDIGYTPKDSTWKKANGEDITNVKDAIDELYSKTTTGIQFDYLYSGVEDLNELFGYAETTSTHWNYFRKNSDNTIGMTIANSNNIMSAYTNNLIDFSNYKYILVEYELYNNHNSLINTSYFGITDSKNVSIDNFIKYGSVIQVGQTHRSGIACIDISDVQGQHYFKVSVHHGTQVSDSNSYTNIKSIKLIK